VTWFRTRFIFYGSFALTGIVFFSSCSEDPSSVGSFLVPADIRIHSDTLKADSSATHRFPLSGNSSTLLLGMYQGDEARLLLQFGIPSGYADSLVVSARVRLTPRYWFKDSLGTLDFTIHKILIPWDESKITYADTNGLYESTARGSFSI